MFETALLVVHALRPSGDRVTIATNAGVGVVAALAWCLALEHLAVL
jgi:hypothetical protein